MRISIQRFLLFLLLILFVTLYAIFTEYYLAQREETAAVILDSLNDDMSELSYILSKNINGKKGIKSSRAILDRITSNNDFIASIMILGDDDFFYTTNPQYHDVPSKESFYVEPSSTAYERLESGKGLEGVVRYYKEDQLHLLTLIFFLDQEEISFRIKQNKTKFFISFGLFPLVILIIFGWMLRHFITKPLEKLRQFAYYQSEIPDFFPLRELESIRYSMLQTFDRLELERNELYKMARTDSLSGIANRNALDEYLERLIAETSRTKKEFALLFIDLDNFKSINDALGHNIGDGLLQEVALIIEDVLRSNDFVARIGGDEFLVVINHYHSIKELITIIERLQTHLSLPRIIQSHPIEITSSIGIAFYPKDGDDIISLMQHADIAMYEAKKKGRSQFHFFTEELNQEVQRAISLDKAMRKALENNEYEIYYQPKIDLNNNEIVGAEALIRWISPKEGIIPPSHFIPAAEDNGFIIVLGKWILKQAMNQQAKWKAAGIDIIISINVATLQLLDKNFERVFKRLLKESDVDPEKIDVEITEYLFLDQNKKNSDVLNMLHDCGVTISLDDFGTGYSSLSYLKQFPIDNLKIDKSFIDDYNTTKGAVFIDTIINLGNTLNMTITAEGVESQQQVDFLKKSKCTFYQGFHTAKPLKVSEFVDFYHSYK